MAAKIIETCLLTRLQKNQEIFMGVSLSQFADYMINGTSFAEDQYYSIASYKKNLSNDEILRIQGVWTDIDSYTYVAYISSAILTFTVSALVGSPLFGVAALVGGIAFTTFVIVRNTDAAREKASWDSFEEGQDVLTRLKCMKFGINRRNDEIQKTSWICR